ncbi:hypothetical protein ABIB62_003318 [Mucilaginibacter sp. UYP25]|uniref:hypothetical protein n=1 Tax=unclassified Mucilaginibacter TaxID=2617802 RepID=UPI003391560B
MLIIEPVTDISFPFHWVDLNYCPDSDAKRVEIYLPDGEEPITGMVDMFAELFSPIEEAILVTARDGGIFASIHGIFIQTYTVMS